MPVDHLSHKEGTKPSQSLKRSKKRSVGPVWANESLLNAVFRKMVSVQNLLVRTLNRLSRPDYLCSVDPLGRKRAPQSADLNFAVDFWEAPISLLFRFKKKGPKKSTKKSALFKIHPVLCSAQIPRDRDAIVSRNLLLKQFARNQYLRSQVIKRCVKSRFCAKSEKKGARGRSELDFPLAKVLAILEPFV